MKADESSQARFSDLISDRLGLVVSGRLDRHLQQALAGAAAVLGQRDADAVCAALAAEHWTTPAWQAVIAAFTVRETSFFRQRSWWDAVIAHAVAPLLAARRSQGTRRLTCHSFGCASGEEVYSLAMMLDRLLDGEPGWTVDIVGFDLCAVALDHARRGLFERRALREVDAADEARWFTPTADRHMAVRPDIRSRVRFELLNLVENAAAAPGDPRVEHPAPADLVLCRNVLIHLDLQRQTDVARYLTTRVAVGGSLAVAPVEATAGWFDPLTVHADKHAILFSRHPKRAGATQPASPPQRRPVPATPVRRKRAAAAVPDGDSTARLRRARHLADMGLFEEARRLCDLAVAESPEADLLMALVCHALGDDAAADAAAARGLDKAPVAPAAHYVHAIICLKTGRREAARQALRRAVALLSDGEDHAPLGRQLGIDAQQILQAARRIGVGGSAGGSHVGRA